MPWHKRLFYFIIFCLRISVPLKIIGKYSPKSRLVIRSLYRSSISFLLRFVFIIVHFLLFILVFMTS